MAVRVSHFNLTLSLFIYTQVIFILTSGIYCASVPDNLKINDTQIFDSVGFENLDGNDVILDKRSSSSSGNGNGNGTIHNHNHTIHSIHGTHLAKWFGISLAVVFGLTFVIAIPLILLYFYNTEYLYRLFHCDWETRSQSEEPDADTREQAQTRTRTPPEYFPSEPPGEPERQHPPAYRIESFSSHHVADRVRRVDRARTAWVRFWAYRHYHIPCRGQDNPPTYFESMLNVNLMEGTTTGDTEDAIELNVIGRTYSRRSSV